MGFPKRNRAIQTHWAGLGNGNFHDFLTMVDALFEIETHRQSGTDERRAARKENSRPPRLMRWPPVDRY
jgi:hypothetical protein